MDVAGLRSSHGQLLVCLTRSPDHFPDCSGDPTGIRLTVPADAPIAHFADLASGTYAIALIHDENGNGRLDTTLGIPREGVGFSRNPRLTFGPPRFSAAQFAIATPAVDQDVRVRYFL